MVFGAGAAMALAVPVSAEAAGGSATAALPAVYANQDGVCTGGEYCMYQNIAGTQSFSDFSVDDPNLANNVYTSPGIGQGTVVANTAKFGWNHDAARTVVICTSPNYTGSCAGTFPNSGGAYSVTYRGNVESLYWS